MSVVNMIVDRFHVGMSDEQVKEEFMRRMLPSATKAEQRKIIKAALKRHHDNQKLYNSVMTGRF